MTGFDFEFIAFAADGDGCDSLACLRTDAVVWESEARFACTASIVNFIHLHILIASNRIWKSIFQYAVFICSMCKYIEKCRILTGRTVSGSYDGTVTRMGERVVEIPGEDGSAALRGTIRTGSLRMPTQKLLYVWATVARNCTSPTKSCGACHCRLSSPFGVVPLCVAVFSRPLQLINFTKPSADNAKRPNCTENMNWVM